MVGRDLGDDPLLALKNEPHIRRIFANPGKEKGGETQIARRRPNSLSLL